MPALVAPLSLSPAGAVDDKTLDRQADPPPRVWRVVPRSRQRAAPAWAIGVLVHEALHYWVFPAGHFDDFIRPFAVELGLADAAEIAAAIHEVRRLLERFRAHPLWAEIDRAERLHEVPYALPGDDGILDILYRTPAGWFIADFKTDQVRSDAEAWQTIWDAGYDQQVQRYARAFAAQTGQQPQVRLVFLNVAGEVRIFDPQAG